MSRDFAILAQTILERCEVLARYSEEAGRLTRRFATPPMKQANATVATWMQAAGMTVWQDNIGNLVGRYEANRSGARTLLLGSHLDTVRDAGKYDGPLGVLIALACVERLHAAQERLPFALELYAFADEEGLRYHTAYLGSSVVAGTFDPRLLSRTDANGITMAEAIRAFGGDPTALQAGKRKPDDLLGYCEVHIEQGPVLESLDLPVGVVSSITGSNRFSVTFKGEAGHAGTVPMRMRHDALCAAAEFILAVEQQARAVPNLVATVGQLDLYPGASNVIPGQVTLSLDVRHQYDATRERACAELRERVFRIAGERRVVVEWQEVQEHASVLCSPALVQPLSQAVERLGYPLHLLPSGAGHDGVMLSTLTDIAMLFVRCKGGVSHHPAESVTREDVAVALHVIDQFVHVLAEAQK
ncbi:MAG: allantoate amidohydrolase [Ktedonobacteraceae bacterium]|nr:allantoate amidohydrolase [Ktedonobacteraceae bacterium]